MISSVSAPAARAEDLVKRYGVGQATVTALDGVSIDIPAGSFTAVMGPSGSGKSTLLHCLAGLDTADSGRIWIGAEELSSMSDRQLTRLRRDRVGFVFQAFNLLPVLSAASNITLPLDIAGRDPDRGWLATVIAAVGLDGRLSHRPSELSGGQQQRVAIARALVSRWRPRIRTKWCSWPMAGSPGRSGNPPGKRCSSGCGRSANRSPAPPCLVTSPAQRKILTRAGKGARRCSPPRSAACWPTGCGWR